MRARAQQWTGCFTHTHSSDCIAVPLVLFYGADARARNLPVVTAARSCVEHTARSLHTGAHTHTAGHAAAVIDAGRLSEYARAASSLPNLYPGVPLK
jgi:hypothetical protein